MKLNIKFCLISITLCMFTNSNAQRNNQDILLQQQETECNATKWHLIEKNNELTKVNNLQQQHINNLTAEIVKLEKQMTNDSAPGKGEKGEKKGDGKKGGKGSDGYQGPPTTKELSEPPSLSEIPAASWGPWGAWDSCTISCGGQSGSRSRWRQCEVLGARCKVLGACQGNADEHKYCWAQPCEKRDSTPKTLWMDPSPGECAELQGCTKCRYWASVGLYQTDKNYMLVNCNFTCGLCPETAGLCTHTDLWWQTDAWLDMHKFDPHSPSWYSNDGHPPRPEPGECRDSQSSLDCWGWAKGGLCKSKKKHMSQLCKKTCGFCSV